MSFMKKNNNPPEMTIIDFYSTNPQEQYYNKQDVSDDSSYMLSRTLSGRSVGGKNVILLCYYGMSVEDNIN